MNEKSALLVNPWIYDFSVYDLWMKPIGLLREATRLRREGYNVSFINCMEGKSRRDNYGCGKFKKVLVPKPDIICEVNRSYYKYGIKEEEFRNYLENIKKPDAVFVGSGMTYWYPGVKDVINIIREYWGNVHITLGGIYAMLCKEHAVSNSGADFIANGDRTLSCDFPAWDLVSDTSSIVVQTSYGCPYNCSYCGIKNIYNGFFQKDPQDVVNEIEYYVKKFSPSDIAFYDDALLVNPDSHIKPILKELVKRSINVRFHTPNAVHARFMDTETAFLMKSAGFETIRLGLETSKENRRDNKVTNEELINAVGYLKGAGFSNREISVYTMFGSLFDAPEDILNDIKFVTETVKVPVKLSAYSLVPGSSDYKQWQIKDDLDPLWHNKTIFPLLNKRYTLDKIHELRQEASAKNRELECEN